MRFWRRRDDLPDRVFLLATEDTRLPLGEQVLEHELDLGIVTTASEDGHVVLPAFTSEKRLVEWMPEGSPWFGLSGRDLLTLFLNGEWHAIVIDPTDPTGRQIRRDEADNLLASSK